MRLDSFVRRAFPAIVLALIAAAACIQAYGISQLVRATLVVPASTARAPTQPSPLDSLDEEAHATSAAEILARNPFDSITGSLNRDHTVATAAIPGDATACDGADVLLIAANEDPSWSFAAVGTRDGVMLRRAGDSIAGGVVSFVAWNRVRIDRPTGACDLLLGAPSTRVSAPIPPKVIAAKGGVPPAIASKIHKTGERSFEIERGAVAQILENPIELLKTVILKPSQPGDKSRGPQLNGIKPDSLLGLLGIENGDRLQDINGFDLSDPKSALEAYARLTTADHLVVHVERNGAPMNMDISVK